MTAANTILNYSICYTAIFILTGVSKINKSNRLFNNEGTAAANNRILTALHIAGIVCLGIIPGIFFKQPFNAIIPAGTLPGFLWMLLFSVLLIVVSFAGFRASRHIHIRYKKNNTLSKIFLTGYFTVRILFLCAYELFFRGFLLFDCIKWMGILPAITLTTGLTVLIHVFTNKKEMWACIPFGILLSVLCIAANAVWPAVIIHLALSLSYEIPPVYQFLTQLKPVK